MPNLPIDAMLDRLAELLQIPWACGECGEPALLGALKHVGDGILICDECQKKWEQEDGEAK